MMPQPLNVCCGLALPADTFMFSWDIGQWAIGHSENVIASIVHINTTILLTAVYVCVCTYI